MLFFYYSRIEAQSERERGEEKYIRMREMERGAKIVRYRVYGRRRR